MREGEGEVERERIARQREWREGEDERWGRMSCRSSFVSSSGLGRDRIALRRESDSSEDEAIQRRSMDARQLISDSYALAQAYVQESRRRLKVKQSNWARK